ncbi:MAG TPA: dihydropteroate synthase [Gemmatimonadales bacterium]|nr:dihydropteroate synthase [Gemmatimonadales bacterium]
MRVTALAGDVPAALASALEARGLDRVHAEALAAGGAAVALLVEPLDEPETSALMRGAARAGLDCHTGDGWALVAGTLARLGGLARPDPSAPLPDRLSLALGRFLHERQGEALAWRTARRAIPLERSCVVGILNVTPDSFSDGGRHLAPDDALAGARAMRAAGAAILDVGGESTRPGAARPDEAEERRRVVPVVRALVAEVGLPVSVDTRRSAVAAAALEAGAEIVNDVSGLTADPRMAGVVREAGAGVVIMHMRGDPQTMDARADYRDVAGDVAAELAERRDRALAAGIAPEQVVLDPGLGFAKHPAHNLALLDRLGGIVALGHPVMVGPSRKRFLGAVTGKPVDGRDAATAAACVAARMRGARLFRVHDVAAACEALAVADAVLGADGEGGGA